MARVLLLMCAVLLPSMAWGQAEGMSIAPTADGGASVSRVDIVASAEVHAEPTSHQPSTHVLMAEPTSDVPAGVLRVRVLPWGEVHLNGEKLTDGQSVVDVAATPGRHELLVRNPLSEEVRHTVDVTADGGELRVRLQPLPATLLLQSDHSFEVRAFGMVIGEVVGGMPTLLEVPLQQWRSSDDVVLVLQRGTWRKEVPLTLEAGRFHSLVVDPADPATPLVPASRADANALPTALPLHVPPKM